MSASLSGVCTYSTTDPATCGISAMPNPTTKASTDFMSAAQLVEMLAERHLGALEQVCRLDESSIHPIIISPRESSQREPRRSDLASAAANHDD